MRSAPDKDPHLGFVRLKEYGYIPIDQTIRIGTVSELAGKFYVSATTDEAPAKKQQVNLTATGIGIDLGVKEFAVASNGDMFANCNKSKEIKRLKKKLRREQRSLSRKYESKKERKEKLTEYSAKIEKNVLRVQRLHHELSRKRREYVRYVVSVLVKTKPRYVTIEDLNITGMMKNRHLSKAIAEQNFYYFRVWLIYMCALFGIEVRVVDRFYPSSKTCCECGVIKRDLKLKDRIFECGDCGNRIDRDLQASINLERCSEYKIVT
jgi:putative transposase